jgi:C_GCAxxG_C_C family probable redox protein
MPETTNQSVLTDSPASPQQAVERFCNGFNCSQSILTLFAKRYGLDERLAMRIATGLGGGVGRSGGICGTLTGATLVLGLEHGPSTPEGKAAKEATYTATHSLQERFIERHGSHLCRDLLEKDLSIEKEYQQARELDLFKIRCPAYVETVVSLLNEWFQEKQNTMKQKILTMLELQDAMNTRVNPHWREAHYPWYRAIWTECAEMLEHYGWKWWKHQKPDMAQVHLELVDIWHFALSDLILRNNSLEEAAEQALDGLNHYSDSVEFREAIEQLAMISIQTQSAKIHQFAQVMQAADLDFEHLFKNYIGKNVLNFFRQDHGYKEGRYIKNWLGREDNEYLAEILEQLDSNHSDFSDQVYQALEHAYPNAQ